MDGSTKEAAEPVGGSVNDSSFGGTFTLLVCVKSDEVPVPSSTTVEVSESMFSAVAQPLVRAPRPLTVSSLLHMKSFMTTTSGRMPNSDMLMHMETK